MRSLTVPLFAIAAASPLAVLLLSLWLGGLWPWLAFGYMVLSALTLDLLVPLAAGEDAATEFPAADAVLVVLGLAMLVSLPLLVATIAGPSDMALPTRIAVFLTASYWFGLVGHPAAHELIHRPRPLFWLGMACYTVLLFGHHTSSHRLIHHRHVASAHDPNTARRGEGFYRFILRAGLGSFRQGFCAEQALRRQKPGLNPYVIYAAGAVACLALGYTLAGWAGVLVWLAFGLHGGMQILLSDYVQHYGLTRSNMPDGKPVPVGVAHSWNAPHMFSAAMMLNAPRHSDHHAHPTRPYPGLRLPPNAPILPWPLPIAGIDALCPPLWRKRMGPLIANPPQA
ncbi:MAG: alkane 1-monooxygenase [Candidatus Saccharibacteria bacterium]|nr:alkane 1-monooxygenase [Pseudorhodobacter sp.]